MNDVFRRKVLQLVAKHGNNQRAAIRASGLPPTVINSSVRGIGPKYPRPETWEKLYKALGEKPPASVRESQAEYGDKYTAMMTWLRANPDHYESFLAMAKGWGYREDKGES